MPPDGVQQPSDRDLGSQSKIALAFLVMSIEGCNEAAARILRAAREKIHPRPSQSKIAQTLGRKQSWLGKIERGQLGLSVGEFLAIADKLGLDPIEAIREIRKAL